jgi:hypothetical protein
LTQDSDHPLPLEYGHPTILSRHASDKGRLLESFQNGYEADVAPVEPIGARMRSHTAYDLDECQNG